MHPPSETTKKKNPGARACGAHVGEAGTYGTGVCSLWPGAQRRRGGEQVRSEKCTPSSNPPEGPSGTPHGGSSPKPCAMNFDFQVSSFFNELLTQ